MGRILLLDDEPAILTVLGTILRSKGHEIKAVSDGEQAVAAIKAGQFDLMLSDVRMNEVNGLEMLALSKEEHPEIPVVMVTAYLTDKTKAEMLDAGAFECLKKPFDVPEVLGVIQKALPDG